MSKYEEQFKRVNRWYDRFKKLNSGKEHTRNTDFEADDVHAFFINCYHLKDWIKNDKASIANRIVKSRYLISHVTRMYSVELEIWTL